ncbi:nephrin-like isoform X2 [Panulirus ornatus]|uniref:nephrin-like isoform X2 n=1 Tax=Panulirus ornatus TaxID=150431 RepID=UPI003A83E733
MTVGVEGGGMWRMVVVGVVLVETVTWCSGDLLDLGPNTHADLVNDILARYPGQDDYVSPTRKVWAVLGGTGKLPCNLTSPPPAEPALLVLWYKNGIDKPIYSLDMRRTTVTHWKSPTHLGSRATFHPGTATLTLQRVQVGDQGTYRCRVDFRTNPTLTFITNLTVIVPPQRLAVYTELGVEARSIVGPFTEGDVLRLTCRATGGSPPPTVTWWERPTLLDMTPEVETPDQVINTLVVPSLTRRDLHRTLTCQAANSNLTAPLVTTVTLDMNFPPLEVHLMSSSEPLSAGNQYVVTCQAAGARPPAVITWRLGHTTLTSHTDKTSHEGNVTRSELILKPDVGDAGRILTCQAQSPALPSHPLIDEWKLDVYYVPEATLRPGRSLNLSNIEEGDDVYFECSIKANPRVYKIIWEHEDTALKHNVSAGVIISNQSLVLQRVARSASGSYRCVASNIEGDGYSNPIHLRVKYAPVCRNPRMTYHGAARHEQVNIPCHLDAHPSPLSYRWTFNNSGESVDIPQEHIEVGVSESTVSYTPNTELDYGTLLCWGTNAVGLQRHPCVFHVFPAGRPDPVHNCSVYNLSEAVVNVRCVAGFDGGLPQTFILELYQPHTEHLLANTTNSVPTFSVPGVPAGMALKGVVYSTNGKGASDKVSLQVYTLKDMAERRTAAVKPSPTQGKSSAQLGVKPIIALVLGALGGLLLVVVLICAVVRLRYGRRGGGGQRGRQGDTLDGQEDLSSSVAVCQPKVPPTTLQDPPLSNPPASTHDCDEKNPDVIPQSDAESWLVEGVNTISSASLPSTYATLPRPQHLCTHPNYQGHSGGDVQYAELLLSGSSPQHQHDLPRGTTTNPQHQHDLQRAPSNRDVSDPKRVVYATLDHKRGHAHHPAQLQHLVFPQPVLATSTPTHAIQQPTPTHTGHPRVGETQQQRPPPWTPPSASLGRRHSSRGHEPQPGDPEVTVPLINNQKESSV